MGCPFEFSGSRLLLLVRIPAALPHRLVVFRFAVTAASGFFPTPVDLVHCRPRAALRFLVRYAATLIALFDVLLLPLLFVRVFRFVSAWHLILHDERREIVQGAYRRTLINASR